MREIHHSYLQLFSFSTHSSNASQVIYQNIDLGGQPGFMNERIIKSRMNDRGNNIGSSISWK